MNIDSSRHLDYEALADLAEGLLDDAQAASAGEHLASCPECREREAELADVTRILAEAPLPPMPTELAARIDAALAAEGMSSPVHGLPDELHTAIGAAPRRLRRFQVLSAAAAAVVVLGGVATVAKVMSVSPDGTSAVVTEPSEHGSSHQSAPQPMIVRPPVYQVVSSGTDYQDATLTTQIKTVLNRVSGRSEVSGRSQSVPGPADVPKCVSAAAQGRTPVLVDVGGRYKGSRVTVIVLRGATPDRLDVVIAGPGCTTGNPDVLTQAQAAAN